MIRSPINEELLKRFSDNSLVLDCPKMQLTQRGTVTPRVITGRGMLSLPTNGPFRLRMYSDAAKFDTFETLKALSSRVQGEIIPETEFYNLEAVDLSGFAWSCEKLLITIQSNGDTAVVVGDFHVLTHREFDRAADGTHSLSMYFFDELDVPWNRVVRSTSTLGERTLREQLALGIAAFTVAPYDFEIQKAASTEDPIVLRATSSTAPFAPVMEARIEEALRFVTASAISWCIVERRDPDLYEVVIAPRRETIKGLFYPPLDNRPDCADDYWGYSGHTSTTSRRTQILGVFIR